MPRPIHLQGRWYRPRTSLDFFLLTKNLLLLPEFEPRICHPVTSSTYSSEIRLWNSIMICDEKSPKQHKATSDIAEHLSLCAAWTTSVKVSTSPRKLASTNLHSVIAAIIRTLRVTSASLRRSEEDVSNSACSTRVLTAWLERSGIWADQWWIRDKGRLQVPVETHYEFPLTEIR